MPMIGTSFFRSLATPIRVPSPPMTIAQSISFGMESAVISFHASSQRMQLFPRASRSVFTRPVTCPSLSLPSFVTTKNRSMSVLSFLYFASVLNASSTVFTVSAYPVICPVSASDFSRWIRYSILPSGPRIGEKSRFRISNPIESA